MLSLFRICFLRYMSEFLLVLMVTFSASSGPIFEKKMLNLSHISRLVVITLESTITRFSSFLLLLDLHMICEIVFHVIFISLLYWWHRLPKYVIFASRMVRFRIALNTEILFFMVKYGREFSDNFVYYTYILSLNLIVVYLGLSIYFSYHGDVKFNILHSKVNCLSSFHMFMQNIVILIEVFCKIVIKPATNIVSFHVIQHIFRCFGTVHCLLNLFWWFHFPGY